MQEDPLSMWNSGEAKARIRHFVHRTTQADGPDFVEPMDRIAVFDNDGTLWVEQPFYSQLRFGLDSLQAQAVDHPEWQDDPIMAAALQRILRRWLRLVCPASPRSRRQPIRA